MRFIVTALLWTAISTPLCAANDDKAFLSWYDGWGTHTVWGIGKIASGSINAAVKCGSSLVPIRAVFDTHDRLADPTATQSPEYCATANRELLKAFRAEGIQCDFNLVPQS
jgi:hypothetical protein